jgi:hypothetical protein
VALRINIVDGFCGTFMQNLNFAQLFAWSGNNLNTAIKKRFERRFGQEPAFVENPIFSKCRF